MIGVRSAPEARVKILVIEDDLDTRENFRDILELDDYIVEVAATAAEVLARTDWHDLAAVILDRQLPDGSAHSLLPELKRLAPEAAVIIVTGHSDLEGAIEALRLGASDYLLKPVNADSLRLRIARVVEHRRLARAQEQSDAVFRSLVELAEVMILMPCFFSDFSRKAETSASSTGTIRRLRLGPAKDDGAGAATAATPSAAGSGSSAGWTLWTEESVSSAGNVG